MKKLYFFLTLCLSMAVITSCKSKNEPNNPDTPQQPDEAFNEWIEEGSKDEIPVSEQNLCGIWQLTRTAEADGELNYLNGMAYDYDGSELHFLEIKNDHSFIDYRLFEEATTKKDGTWEITGKQMSFDIKVDPNNCSLPMWKQTKYMVYRCEAEELALTCSEKGHLKTVSRQDSIGEITSFFIFKRLYELPELPVPLAEVIAATPWKVLSDTMYLGKYVYVSNESNGFGGDIYQPVKLEQTNMIPQNAVITFAPDLTLEIKEANGDVIAKATWEPRGLESLAEFPGVTRKVFTVHIKDENGAWHEEDIIPGMPNSMYFYMDSSNDKRAVLTEMRPLSANETQGELSVRSWIYHIEAIK